MRQLQGSKPAARLFSPAALALAVGLACWGSAAVAAEISSALNHKPPPGISALASTGTLKVVTLLIDTNGTSLANVNSFLIRASCTPDGPINRDMIVHIGPGSGVTINVAGGGSCSVIEPRPQATLNPIPHYPACNGGGASITTSYSAQPVIIASNATTTITVTHTIKCDPSAPRFREILKN